MTLSKKSQGQRLLMILIIIGIAAVFLFFFVGKLEGPFTSQSNIEKCRLNVLLASKSTQLIELTACKTDEYGVLQGDTTRKISEEIGGLLYNCWYQFGEGELQPFKGAIESYPLLCFLCSSFTMPSTLNLHEDVFENHLSQLEPFPGTTYEDYLSPAFIAYKDSGRTIIFIDYLNWDKGFSILDSPGIPGIHEVKILSPDKTYYVMFQTYSQRRSTQYIRGLTGKSDAGAYGHMIITPAENTDNVGCSIIY